MSYTKGVTDQPREMRVHCASTIAGKVAVGSALALLVTVAALAVIIAFAKIDPALLASCGGTPLLGTLSAISGVLFLTFVISIAYRKCHSPEKGVFLPRTAVGDPGTITKLGDYQVFRDQHLIRKHTPVENSDWIKSEREKMAQERSNAVSLYNYKIQEQDVFCIIYKDKGDCLVHYYPREHDRSHALSSNEGAHFSNSWILSHLDEPTKEMILEKVPKLEPFELFLYDFTLSEQNVSALSIRGKGKEVDVIYFCGKKGRDDFIENLEGNYLDRSSLEKKSAKLADEYLLDEYLQLKGAYWIEKIYIKNRTTGDGEPIYVLFFQEKGEFFTSYDRNSKVLKEQAKRDELSINLKKIIKNESEYSAEIGSFLATVGRGEGKASEDIEKQMLPNEYWILYEGLAHLLICDENGSISHRYFKDDTKALIALKEKEGKYRNGKTRHEENLIFAKHAFNAVRTKTGLSKLILLQFPTKNLIYNPSTNKSDYLDDSPLDSRLYTTVADWEKLDWTEEEKQFLPTKVDPRARVDHLENFHTFVFQPSRGNFQFYKTEDQLYHHLNKLAAEKIQKDYRINDLLIWENSCWMHPLPEQLDRPTCFVLFRKDEIEQYFSSKDDCEDFIRDKDLTDLRPKMFEEELPETLARNLSRLFFSEKTLDPIDSALFHNEYLSTRATGPEYLPERTKGPKAYREVRFLRMRTNTGNFELHGFKNQTAERTFIETLSGYTDSSIRQKYQLKCAKRVLRSLNCKEPAFCKFSDSSGRHFVVEPDPKKAGEYISYHTDSPEEIQGLNAFDLWSRLPWNFGEMEYMNKQTEPAYKALAFQTFVDEAKTLPRDHYTLLHYKYDGYYCLIYRNGTERSRDYYKSEESARAAVASLNLTERIYKETELPLY